jgi:opacity protein-like surface antigen
MHPVARASRALIALTLGLALLAAPARAGGYYHKGTFVLGGGFNNPVGEANPYFNTSGSFYFAGGRNINEAFGLQVEYTHHWLAIDPSVIDRAAAESTQVQDAHASLWSMTLNGVYRIHPKSDIVPWLTAGGGYYKRNIQLTQNALVYYPPIWDPWWGWIDGGWAPGEAIVGQRADAGFGFNVGFGVDFEIENGASLFLETRYHHAFLDGVDMQVVPIMAGVRW